MELYFSRNSGNSSRSVFALMEAGAAWTPHPIDPQTQENRAAPYLGLNPMGKLPSLVDGELVLWESNAINWYVAEQHPQARLLPESLAARARVQRWMFFQAAHVSPACMPILRITPRVQNFWKMKGDAQAAEAGRLELQRYLAVLEEALGNREWLEGEFSLADISYAPHLMLIQEGGFDFAPHQRVKAWLERLLARPAWKSTFELIFAGT